MDACLVVTRKVTRFQKLAYLLKRVRAKGLAVFVDVDVHGIVATIWNNLITKNKILTKPLSILLQLKSTLSFVVSNNYMCNH
ncbi:MAG: hypothetical protein HOI70_10935 [Opitutae bacterium]|nr:hypothetical protein [Opitutae bacterium]